MLLKVGTFILAERKSIVIDDEDVKLNLRSDGSGSASSCASGSGSGCDGPIKNREITINARFLGGLPGATILYNLLDTYLATICNTNQVRYVRQVKDETQLEYMISSAYIQPTDMKFERFCPPIKSGVIHLITAEEDNTTQIASANYTVLKPVN